MSRLLRPMPFDLQTYDCRPGHTLCWLCGVTEELVPRYHANGNKPMQRQQATPSDERQGAAKGRNSEAKAR